MVTFDQLYAGISAQESGGRKDPYNAKGIWLTMNYGRDRAYGKYQIMGANIPGWSRKYLGHSISIDEFLARPELQEKIARGRLQDYWKQYKGNARMVAAAWYGGPGMANNHMSTRSQYGGPSIKQYVDEVLEKGGASSSGGSTTSAMTPEAVNIPAAPPEVRITLTNDELAEAYGFNMRLMNSNKELKALFKEAVKGDWGASEVGKLRFLARLKNTRWWTSQSADLRKYITLRATDPSTFKQNQQQAYARLNTLAVNVGIGNQMPGGKPTQILKDAAYYAMANGWTDARIKNWMGAKVTAHGGLMSGEAGEAFDTMHELAYANGLTLGENWYADRARSVVSGTGTMQDVENQIRKLAAARYKAYGAQIKAGMNVMDLAAPYIRSFSTLMEVPDTDVDVFNKHVAAAMTGGADGNGKSLWQFENEVRNDPLWRKTNNARESMMGVAHQVAKDFGFSF